MTVKARLTKLESVKASGLPWNLAADLWTDEQLEALIATIKDCPEGLTDAVLQKIAIGWA
jgi:hypothetical protein